MKTGTNVKVNAPGHFHDGMIGEVIATAEGEVTHYEPDGTAVKLTKELARELFRSEEVYDPQQADVFVEGRGIARYRFDQLEEVD